MFSKLPGIKKVIYAFCYSIEHAYWYDFWRISKWSWWLYTEAKIYSGWYQFLPSEKLPKLFSSSLYIIAMFGSTCFVNSFFATKSINKSVLYSRLTDEHLHFLLRLTNLQDLEPNIESLLTTKCCQKSSSPWTVWGQIYLPQTVKHQGCCGLTALYHLVTGWMSVLRVTLLMIIYYSNSQYTHSSNE